MTRNVNSGGNVAEINFLYRLESLQHLTVVFHQDGKAA